ncbi:FecR family protein [Chitinophaga cymbidii]|uniref:Iron dicitrate transporter FecR n=1 Tax=Chitinophaga cymbidii TaxID=1096750 RepID=A0A512RKB0_9BACT|nr:FecR family protein [Chitinophaga cymbidii]GEP96112.1 iron dicitrate transporter FecR [Chitinophaga cymbidii]
MNNQERIHHLIGLVLSQQADAETYEQLQALLRDDPDGQYAAEIAAVLDKTGATDLPPYDRQAWEHVVSAVLQADKPVEKTKVVKGRFRYWWAAAAVLLLIAAGSLLWPRPSERAAITAQQPVNDAPPGGSKATLTLADGSVVTLDSAGNQVLQQGNTAVRQQGGQLSYDAQGDASTISYNTLRTPRGGQFQVKLPDGTKVWLNAASSISYPTAFQGRERMVQVTGEAYFEVTKDAAMPFRVKVNELATIEVLGTNFNINAYEDEAAIYTTLLEGAVRVRKGTQSATLRPGQQAQIDAGIKVVKDADIEKAVAWKNGVFDFRNARLKDVMRELARWYDITVVYQGNVPEREFWGKMGRNLTLSQVLKGIEGTGVNFEIQDNGKKLVVLP